MKKRSVVCGGVAITCWVLAVQAQSGGAASAADVASAAQTARAARTAQTTSGAPAAAQAVTPRAAQLPTPLSAPPPGIATAVTADDHKAFIKQNCVACHSDRAKAAGMDSARKLSFDTLDSANIARDARTWELVVRKLRAGMMPPASLRRPELAQFTAMIGYVESALDRAAAPFAPPPGLHRLNRTEYTNVVRDLLNLNVDASKYLPSDDSTSGFDNIAGALGISSTLVEAYVSAAQKISRLAMGYPEQPTLAVYRTREDTSQDYHVEGLPFGTRGGLLVNHTFPSDGEYTLTVTPIFGDNMSPTGFGSVPCERIDILLDSDRLQLMDWQGGGRAPAANCGRGRPQAAPVGQAGPEAFFGGRGGTPMRVRFKTTAGSHGVGVTFLATNFAPLLDLDKHFLRSTLQTGPTPGYTFFPHVGTIRIEGPFGATQAASSPSRDKIFICRPTSAATEKACARRIVGNLATYAFRRPVTAQDIDLLMAFYEFGRKEKDFDQGIEMVLARVLASPQFIYRIEEEPAPMRTSTVVPAGQAPSRTYRVSDIDLASRLSFFLWSSSPDEELLRVATQGRLKNPLVLEQQVRRMLAHPKAEALAANFAGQWLNLRGLDATSPLPLIYPDFDDPLRQAMRREVELLFDAIVREDRPVTDLLTADYTFVNERLAKHYGIPNVTGSQFRRVTLGAGFEARHGLTGKGAFLATTSKPERTSPVTRGKWIMANLLGMSPPDPPADVPPLPARAADPNAKEPSMRKKMMDHRVRPDCVTCHQLMDPIGFALENFDGIGLWRSHDEGDVVDPKAQTFDRTPVDGPVSLRQWLAKTYSGQFVSVAAEKLLTYGLGRGVEYRDMPLVRTIARDTAKSANRFSALVLGVVTSRPFQMNMRLDEPAPATASLLPGGGLVATDRRN
jgi:mono/diheme cytochrome c family protein